MADNLLHFVVTFGHCFSDSDTRFFFRFSLICAVNGVIYNTYIFKHAVVGLHFNKNFNQYYNKKKKKFFSLWFKMSKNIRNWIYSILKEKCQKSVKFWYKKLKQLNSLFHLKNGQINLFRAMGWNCGDDMQSYCRSRSWNTPPSTLAKPEISTRSFSCYYANYTIIQWFSTGLFFSGKDKTALYSIYHCLFFIFLYFFFRKYSSSFRLTSYQKINNFLIIHNQTTHWSLFVNE